MSLREYAAFALRRLLRIYPALLATLLFALLVLVASHVPQTSEAAGKYFLMICKGYDPPLGWATLVRNALLKDTSLDNVLWTLRPEIFCSLALPVLHAISVPLRGPLRFGLRR